MIRPARASNPDSPITVARQRVPRRYRQRHRSELVWWSSCRTDRRLRFFVVSGSVSHAALVVSRSARPACRPCCRYADVINDCAAFCRLNFSFILIRVWRRQPPLRLLHPGAGAVSLIWFGARRRSRALKTAQPLIIYQIIVTSTITSFSRQFIDRFTYCRP